MIHISVEPGIRMPTVAQLPLRFVNPLLSSFQLRLQRQSHNLLAVRQHEALVVVSHVDEARRQAAHGIVLLEGKLLGLEVEFLDLFVLVDHRSLGGLDNFGQLASIGFQLRLPSCFLIHLSLVLRLNRPHLPSKRLERLLCACFPHPDSYAGQ